MEIRVETRARHIVLVTIANEPRRNAMSRAMMAELAALWDRLDADAECRCVVLTGAGEKAFSSGADLGGDLSASPETARIVNRALLKNTVLEADRRRGKRRLRRRRPRIAAVDRHPRGRARSPLRPARGPLVDLSVRRRHREIGAADRSRARDGSAADRAAGRCRLCRALGLVNR